MRKSGKSVNPEITKKVAPFAKNKAVVNLFFNPTMPRELLILSTPYACTRGHMKKVVPFGSRLTCQIVTSALWLADSTSDGVRGRNVNYELRNRGKDIADPASMCICPIIFLHIYITICSWRIVTWWYVCFMETCVYLGLNMYIEMI
jgi:hypothetical protein